jgi:hypothetical protein
MIVLFISACGNTRSYNPVPHTGMTEFMPVLVQALAQGFGTGLGQEVVWHSLISGRISVYAMDSGLSIV